MNLKKFALVGLLFVSSLFAETFKIDQSHSSIGFKVKHMMISNVKGTFDNFSGTFDFDEKTNTLQALDGTIEVASINTANEKRDKHLRADDIFDAAKYHIITFKLTKLENDKAYGTFTMKGVTKDIVLDYEPGGSIVDMRGNTVAGFTLSGKLKRSDYGITWNRVLEAGGVAVGDEVKLEIEIEGKLNK